MIDIGGPALVRAAAKNHKFVTVISSIEQYKDAVKELKEQGGFSPAFKRQMAREAFRTTASLDGSIAAYFEAMVPSAAVEAAAPCRSTCCPRK